MERTCLFFYVMLYLLFYFEAEKVKKDVKTSIYLILVSGTVSSPSSGRTLEM